MLVLTTKQLRKLSIDHLLGVRSEVVAALDKREESLNGYKYLLIGFKGSSRSDLMHLCNEEYGLIYEYLMEVEDAIRWQLDLMNITEVYYERDAMR